jgi:hypothetical protein
MIQRRASARTWLAWGALVVLLACTGGASWGAHVVGEGEPSASICFVFNNLLMYSESFFPLSFVFERL